MDKKTNIAFYKKSQEIWTEEEYIAIKKYCKDDYSTVPEAKFKRKWIYTVGTAGVFPWHEQEKDEIFNKCKQVAYEDIFDSKNEPYVYPIYVTPLKIKAKTVIKFTSLTEAIIVKEGIYAKDKGGGFNELKGFHTNSWTPHTDTSSWEILKNYKEEPELTSNYNNFKIGDVIVLTDDAIKTLKRNENSNISATIKDIKNRSGKKALLTIDRYITKHDRYTIDEGWCKLYENIEDLEECEIEDLEECEVEYPIYIKSKLTGKIIKFISLNKGHKWNESEQRFATGLEGWVNHNDVEHWKEIDNPEKSSTIKKTWSEVALKQAMEESLFSKFYKSENKENNMQTVEIKIDGKKVDLEENKVCKVKTDLERKPKWLTIWFDKKGQKCDNTEDSPKEAKKQLQKPENLGKTFRSYKLTESYTTDIPVVAC